MDDAESAELETAVSRLGGDEFSILLSRIREPEVAGEIASRLIGEITASICIEGHDVAVTPSIGIAVFPGDGTHADAIAVVLRDLRHMGVKVALDDFGTGLSSFGYLKHCRNCLQSRGNDLR